MTGKHGNPGYDCPGRDWSGPCPVEGCPYGRGHLHHLPCEACYGEGQWFRYEGEGDAHSVPCDICNGTGRDQFAAPMPQEDVRDE